MEPEAKNQMLTKEAPIVGRMSLYRYNYTVDRHMANKQTRAICSCFTPKYYRGF